MNDIAAIRPVPRDGTVPLPLSSAQERLWFMQQLQPGMLAYQFQAKIEFAGTLDAGLLAAALTEVVRRHEAYRTTFADGPDGPIQVVHPPYRVEVPVEDLRGAGAASEADVIRAAVAAQIPVDRLPLVHWRLLRTADDRHVLLHVEHHLVHDGWAFNLFVDELCALYQAYAAGEPSPLPEPTAQFADFAVWQQSWLAGPDADKQLAYWREQLDGVPYFVDLATDRPRTPVRRFTGDAPRYTVPAELADAVRALAARERVPLFSVMLAVFEVLIADWSGQDDFCVATGMAARTRPEVDGMFGMLVNTVALRADLQGDPTFRELLGRVRKTTFGALEHQDLPFDRVVAALRPPRMRGRQPLCEVLFAFHDSPLRAVQIPGLEVEVTPAISNGSAKFDLNVIAVPRAEQTIGQRDRATTHAVELIWEYDRDLFDAATVARAAGRYERLLAAVTAAPDTRISALTGGDRQQGDMT
ncbi:condensation domain-containing protein [Streptomyces canus]|uniref:condensation domain-containing protein n=1 Tax=Streptomyces canus TaxID=58343 RepID=UPI00386AA3F1|nr:condensation domain-containing protein [Streptomyces canus]